MPFSVPFSLAVLEDKYDPWTNTAHKFKFYTQPVVESINPSEAQVREILDVYVHSKKPTEFMERKKK
jgi:hypothetical protein